MKRYFLDTNYCLRFILKDNEDQHKEVVECFIKAEQGRLEIVVAPEVLIEAQYVLRKVYRVSNERIGKALLKFIQMPFLTVLDENVYIEALTIYQKLNIDLEDLILFFRARGENAEVLSFDEDIKKLEKLFNR